MIDQDLDARVALLYELFDDAGLFPPASLSMRDALAGYSRARTGTFAWMSARFVCPASRLAELDALRPQDKPARLSVLVDPADPAAAIDRPGVEAVEAKVQAGEIPGFAKALEAAGFAGSALAEIAPSPDWEDAVEEIARIRGPVLLGAKIRCGGATPEAIPPVRLVAAFIARCRDLRLRFKATAGLHHPIRRMSPDGLQHGFLNLAVASTLAAVHSLDMLGIEQVIAETDPAAFRLSAAAVGWRDGAATAADVNAARMNLFAGIGSCSFDEPVADLTALGVLPVSPITR